MWVNAQEYTVAFEVSDQTTGAPLESAEIAIQPCACGGITNASGAFSINLEKNRYSIRITYIGYESYAQQLELTKNEVLKVSLSEIQEELSEVVVRAKRINDNLEVPQMGVLQLHTRELTKIPWALARPMYLKV